MPDNFGDKRNIAGLDKHPENINRKGAPKGFKGLTATLRDILEADGTMIVNDIIELDENKKETGKVIKFGKVKIPKGEMIILAAARRALKGDMRAIEYMTNRMEGKARQFIEFTGNQPSLPPKYDLSILSLKDMLSIKKIQEKLDTHLKKQLKE